METTHTPFSPWATMEMWLNDLPDVLTYELREELPSGKQVCHQEFVTKDKLESYVRGIWLEEHPPTLIICPTFNWPPASAIG